MKLKNLFPIFLFVAIVNINVAAVTVHKKEPVKPNILFIMLDDLGKEWVETYGADDVKTPTIDKLADTGLKLENVYSMPQCTPSRVTLLTGQYPWRHGWINHYDVPRWGHGGRFDPEMNPAFAKYVRDAGYKTCIAGKWQINDFRIEPDILNKVGFDEYCMWTGAEGGNVEKSQKRYWDPYIHTKEGSKTYKGQFGDDIFSDFIIDFMKRNKNKPMMIYYPMCLTHGPLTTTPAEPNAPREEQHKAMVRYTDIILKKILTALDALKIRDNTIIFWTTDNGTSGNIIGHLNGNPVRGGKTYLSENGVNAPFIVNCPGLVPQGKISDALVDFTDMLPTFCDLAGAKLPADFVIDGHSFAPLILGKTNDSKRNWIMGLGSNAAKIENGRIKNAFVYRDRAIRNKRFKAYVNTSGEIYEIIDLENDFYEQNNLIDSDDVQILKAKNEFQKVINKIPKKDNNPIYKKGTKSFYDIPEEELLKSCLKGMEKANKSKPFTEAELKKLENK
ncbi:MAG: sulfatase-like hydrolase/transferase [Prolixibacteraceae bacterium]|nr:sulfatase-like hydrolase/transferase [Prolixibacteraceae bacterium]